ncbi:hybrid sensor histidine kinase/response regulator [Candidatus Binatus sp.]|uniref:hybrid sensor histidine kinase/response regulator n=1 Tax=Candidatus Binatus sp. TaxID=2811406 RepID=UPI003C5E0A2C
MADEDLYQYFKIEAREIVADLSRDILGLEKDGAGAEPLARLLRQAHTLKGAARVVRLPRIAEIAHAMEDALAPHRGSLDAVSKDQIGRLLQQVDIISSEISALDPPPQPGTQSRPAALEPFERVRVGVAEMDALLSGVSETAVQLDGIRRGIEVVREVEDRLAALQQQLTDAKPGARLHETVEEMRLALQHARQGLGMRADSTEREVAEVRGNIDRLRLLPTSLLFPALERAVRDAAEMLGRQVVFHTSGREQRLESHVLSALGEALSHLVRNAVAHGIENPQDRLARGKPACGEVSLKIERGADRIIFTCSDDGSGIDVDAVRRAAVDRGVMSAASAAALTPADALELIFTPGVTTSPSLNEVAGRGIGLEVVREVVGRFKGQVRVRSDLGIGTSVEIEVPVSLSSVRAILLAAGDLLIWIPLDAVHSALRLGVDAIVSLAGQSSLIFEGRAIPFIRLAETMGRPLTSGVDSRPHLATIVQAGAELLAVGVDRVIHASEVIVHPLPTAAGRVAMLAGAVFDAQGNPQLVLNPDALLEAAHAVSSQPMAAATPAPHILVIDDSLTSRVLLKSILETGGFKVDLAVSGEDAMAKASERHYSLFVCDVEMPGMNGFEFVARTREYDYLQGIPTVLVTTRGGADDRRRGAEAGARAYIVKGEFSKDSLLETVRMLVG